MDLKRLEYETDQDALMTRARMLEREGKTDVLQSIFDRDPQIGRAFARRWVSQGEPAWGVTPHGEGNLFYVPLKWSWLELLPKVYPISVRGYHIKPSFKIRAQIAFALDCIDILTPVFEAKYPTNPYLRDSCRTIRASIDAGEERDLKREPLLRFGMRLDTPAWDPLRLPIVVARLSNRIKNGGGDMFRSLESLREWIVHYGVNEGQPALIESALWHLLKHILEEPP